MHQDNSHVQYINWKEDRSVSQRCFWNPFDWIKESWGYIPDCGQIHGQLRHSTSLFVRSFDGECFREDILCLISLNGHSTGKIFFQRIVALFSDNGLDLEIVVTDGTPSMASKVDRLSVRLSAVAPKMKLIHCFLHQSVPCAWLSGELNSTMDTVMSIINFIRSMSSLQHRLFHQLLAEM